MTDTRAVLIGLAVLALASLAVFLRGDRMHRLIMTIIVICWAAAAVGQLATGSPIVPVIICDLVLAAALLGIVLRHNRPWLYALFAVEACRLLLHGAAFRFGVSPSSGYRLANNTLSTLGLIVLVVAALWPRKRQDADEV